MGKDSSTPCLIFFHLLGRNQTHVEYGGLAAVPPCTWWSRPSPGAIAVSTLPPCRSGAPPALGPLQSCIAPLAPLRRAARSTGKPQLSRARPLPRKVAALAPLQEPRVAPLRRPSGKILCLQEPVWENYHGRTEAYFRQFLRCVFMRWKNRPIISRCVNFALTSLFPDMICRVNHIELKLVRVCSFSVCLTVVQNYGGKVELCQPRLLT